MDDYIIDGDLAFSSTSSALKFYREQYHKKKEWQGLTDEERNACLVEADPCEALLEHEAWQLMVDIEAKLKEKNNAV